MPTVKGIIIKNSDIQSLVVENDTLTGYRIEYYDQYGIKIPNMFRIVTSNNKCEPINQNLTSSNQKSIRYRFVWGAIAPSPSNYPHLSRSGRECAINKNLGPTP